MAHRSVWDICWRSKLALILMVIGVILQAVLFALLAQVVSP